MSLESPLPLTIGHLAQAREYNRRHLGKEPKDFYFVFNELATWSFPIMLPYQIDPKESNFRFAFMGSEIIFDNNIEHADVHLVLRAEPGFDDPIMEYFKPCRGIHQDDFLGKLRNLEIVSDFYHKRIKALEENR